MKTLYTLFIVLLVAVTAKAQTPVTVFSETFSGPSYQLSWSADWGTSTTAPLSNSATPEPGSGGSYLTVTNGNAVTSALTLQVDASSMNGLEVSWYERRTGTNKIVTRSFTYTVGTTTATLVPTSTAVSDSWTKFSIPLGVIANYANNVSLTWTTTTESGNVKYAIDDVVVKAKVPSLTVSETSLKFEAAEPGVAVVKTYSLTGANLTTNVVVTAPSKFLVSLDNTAFANSVTVVPAGGTVAGQNIYVKYESFDGGSHLGNITNVTNGTTKNVAVEGVTSPKPVTVLPVELASFSGQSLDGKASLSWTTATEKNNAKFVVERSKDGKAFKQVGEVKGNGNSAIRLNYSFTDKAPAGGINYYRLRQVDFDGTESFSNILALEVAVKEVEFSVYPTVASQVVTIATQQTTGACTFTVIDSNGKVVAVITSELALIELPVQNLQKGTYFVKVAEKQFVKVQRFIKN